MRTNTPITNRERVFSEHQRIVSTTTPGGVLNSVNQHFIDISGFAKEELIGQPHNLVRHPEMPSAAFKDLWSTIKSNRPWMGLVKNRCKNGDFYWVDAFVSPMISDNKTIGYQSVRIKPTAEAVKRATNLYRDINKPPNIFTKAFSWRPSLMGKILLSGLISLAVLLIGAQFISATSTIGLVSLASLGAITQFFLSSLIAAPWKKAASEAASIFENPIAQKIYTGRDDELGQLQLAMQFLKAQQNTIIWRSSEAVEDLSAAASEANDVAESTQENMNALSQEVDMVATAMTEMTATVQEVAQHAAESASVIQNANHNVNEGQTVVNESKEIINRLSTRIDEAARVIQGLAEDSQRIGSVTDVIDSIAEQTNLLALNAAIEAARAGDLGRGFAVVADEVRSLAGKTQASTGEISAMIISLQGAAKAAVASMQESKSAADESVSHSAKTQSALEVISDNITTVNDMSIQIATAAEEQSAVSEEINRNIVNINENAGSTLNGCRRVKDSNAVVIDNINKLKNMIIQFNNH